MKKGPKKSDPPFEPILAWFEANRPLPRSELNFLSPYQVDEYGGEIPRDIDALMTLPGVGRKTANVVTSVLYDEPVIAVDTHVFRVAHRLGLSDGKTPYAVELDLEAGIPESVRPKAHHWLILHGRYVCTARNPKCGECGLAPYCRHAQSR